MLIMFCTKGKLNLETREYTYIGLGGSISEYIITVIGYKNKYLRFGTSL